MDYLVIYQLLHWVHELPGLHGLHRMTSDFQIVAVTFHIWENRLFLLTSPTSFVLTDFIWSKRDSQRDKYTVTGKCFLCTCFKESDTMVSEKIHNPGWKTKETRIIQTASTDVRLPNSWNTFPYYGRIGYLNMLCCFLAI